MADGGAVLPVETAVAVLVFAPGPEYSGGAALFAAGCADPCGGAFAGGFSGVGEAFLTEGNEVRKAGTGENKYFATEAQRHSGLE